MLYTEDLMLLPCVLVSLYDLYDDPWLFLSMDLLTWPQDWFPDGNGVKGKVGLLQE